MKFKLSLKRLVLWINDSLEALKLHEYLVFTSKLENKRLKNRGK